MKDCVPNYREVPRGGPFHLGELGVAAKRSTGIRGGDAVARTSGWRKEFIAGVADQGEFRLTGNVNVLGSFNDLGCGIKDIGQVRVGNGVCVVDPPLFKERMPQPQGGADRFLSKVVILTLPVEQVNAAGYLGVVEPRVGEVQVVAGGLAAGACR